MTEPHSKSDPHRKLGDIRTNNGSYGRALVENAQLRAYHGPILGAIHWCFQSVYKFQIVEVKFDTRAQSTPTDDVLVWTDPLRDGTVQNKQMHARTVCMGFLIGKGAFAASPIQATPWCL